MEANATVDEEIDTLGHPVVLESKDTIKDRVMGFPGGAVVESLPADAGDTGSSPGLGGSHMPRSS